MPFRITHLTASLKRELWYVDPYNKARRVIGQQGNFALMGMCYICDNRQAEAKTGAFAAGSISFEKRFENFSLRSLGMPGPSSITKIEKPFH